MVPYARCRRCGRHRREVGKISRIGNCLECGTARLQENIRSLHEHRGEPYERWRVALLRAMMDLPRV